MATITNFNVDEFDSMNVVEEYKKISVNDPVNFYTWSKKKFVDRLCAVANLQIDDHLPGILLALLPAQISFYNAHFNRPIYP